jgi:predicted deacylase
MCTMACGRNGIPSVAFELGGQGAIVPQSVEQGVTAIRNLLKLHRMMPGALELPKEVAIFDPWRSDLIKKTFRRPTYEKYWAQHPGLVVRRREPHTFVRKGDIVCQVVNPYTGKIVQTARAARSGGLYSMTDEAVCNKGDRLFVVSLAWKVRPAEYLRKIKNRFGASPATKEESRHGA